MIANARVLGVLLAQRVREHELPMPGLLVPVPLHAARLRERGFNQAFAIARYAGRMLGIPVARNLVRRLRNTPSQTALDVHQRHHNVRGAFAVARCTAMRRLLEAGHVAIVDDVIDHRQHPAGTARDVAGSGRQPRGSLGRGPGVVSAGTTATGEQLEDAEHAIIKTKSTNCQAIDTPGRSV